MEEIKLENGPQIKDISSEFLSMNNMDFSDFLDELKSEGKNLFLIKIDWKDEITAIRLKAIKQNAFTNGLTINITIRATRNQKAQFENVFYSGVKWEEI